MDAQYDDCLSMLCLFGAMVWLCDFLVVPGRRDLASKIMSFP